MSFDAFDGERGSQLGQRFTGHLRRGIGGLHVVAPPAMRQFVSDERQVHVRAESARHEEALLARPRPGHEAVW